MKISKLLTKQNFINWLGSYRNNKIIGVACEEDNCPLANFIKANSEISNIDVEPDGVSYSKNNRTYRLKLELWATNFINTIDNENKIYQDITVKTCLDILRRS